MVPAVLLLAFLSASTAPDVGVWIPARWPSHDVKSLSTVRETPVNCLLLEQRDWDPAFIAAAGEQGIATLGVIRPDGQAVDAARAATAARITGIALEGDFSAQVRKAIESLNVFVVPLPSRSDLRFDSSTAVVGTWQGMWPGIQIQKNGVAVSAPSGAPWIDTNAGFLRFVRSEAHGRPVWVANTPPAGMAISTERYMQAIADAESEGAHWVIALDDDFTHRLLAGEAKAVAEWRRMGGLLAFYASHPEWRTMRPYSSLALIEDVNSGALLAGGIMDMLAAKHTTVLPVPLHSFDREALDGTTLAVDVDPASLTSAQTDVLKAWTRSGNTLLTAPPGWKMPMPENADHIVLSKEQIAQLGEIWHELNSLLNSRNPGAKVFNAPGAISNLLAAPGGRPLVLQLVNYSDYPVEDVTVRLPGKFTSAKMLEPGAPPKPVDLFEDGSVTEVSIPRFGVVAAVVLD